MENRPSTAKRLTYALPVTAIYLILNIFLLTRHEPGSAEALVYLTNFGSENMAGSGFPVLTALLLMPLKGIGLPFSMAGLISLVFMTGAALIVLLCSPFHPVLSILMVLSPVFGYFLGIQLTPFAPAVFLIVALAALFPVRRRWWLLYWVLVALLFQTHITLWGFAAALTGTDIVINWMVRRQNPDTKTPGGVLKVFLPFLLPLASCGYSIYLLTGSSLSFKVRSFGSLMRSILRVALTLVGQASGMDIVIQWVLILCLVFALGHVFFTVRMPWQTFILALGIALQGIASYMVGSIPVQSGMVTFFMTVWFVWIILGYTHDESMVHVYNAASSGNVELEIFVGLLFLLPAIGYFSVIRSDVPLLYSDARNTAAQVRLIAGDDLVVTADSRYAMSLAAQDPDLVIADMVHGTDLGDLLYGKMQPDGKITADAEAPATYSELTEAMALRGLAAPGDTWYLLTTENSVLSDMDIWSTVMENVYTTESETVGQESFRLYKVQMS